MNLRLFPLLIGCIVALLPLYIRISSVNLERVSKTNALLCLIPILILLFNEKLRSFPIILKSILIAAMFHLIIFQYEPAAMIGIYQSISICAGSMFLIKYHESYNESDNNIIFNSMCIGALIQCVMAAFQIFNVDIYSGALLYFNKNTAAAGPSADGHRAIFGSFQNPNILGAYLAMCLPAFFRSRNLVFLSVIVFAAIVSTESLMPIAAAILAVSYFIVSKLNNKFEKFYYILFPIFFYGFCFIFPGATSDRAMIWSWYLDKIDLRHFLIGKSTSWLPLNVMYIGTGFVDNVHNEFLTLLNIFGILSLAAVGYIIYLVVINKDKNRIFAATLFASFFIMLGNFPMHIASTSFLTLIALAHCLKGSYVGNVEW